MKTKPGWHNEGALAAALAASAFEESSACIRSAASKSQPAGVREAKGAFHCANTRKNAALSGVVKWNSIWPWELIVVPGNP